MRRKSWRGKPTPQPQKRKTATGVTRLRIEIQDDPGRVIPGRALEDGPEMIGDALDRVVRWRDGSQVRPLAGRPVRLRFVMKDADLFAFWLR